MNKGLFLALMLAVTLSGCSTNVTVDDGFTVDKTLPFEVGVIENSSGVNPDGHESVELMKSALDKAIAESQLPVGSEGYTVDVLITDYIPGNAFKRWLVMGWGTTKLTVKFKLIDEDNVNEIEVSRSISAGGAFTIGAWQTVFKDVADSVVEEIKTRTI
jgi:hypothetical protein